MIEFENLTLEEWGQSLKPYQFNIILQLVRNYGEMEAAEKWINAKGPQETATFGDISNSLNTGKNYWYSLRDEFNKLICGHPDYTKEREKLISTGKIIGLGGVSYISTLLSPIVGLSVPILTPAVMLLLHTAGKMGINAYCSMVTTNSDN